MDTVASGELQGRPHDSTPAQQQQQQQQQQQHVQQRLSAQHQAEAAARNQDVRTDRILNLVQSVVQGMLPPLLDDLSLDKFDPERWALSGQGPSETESKNHDQENLVDSEGEAAGNRSPIGAKKNAKSALQFALSQVLLTPELDEMGSSNTVVNEIQELTLPIRSPISTGNVGRLLLTNSLHASLVTLRDLSARNRWSSSMVKAAASDIGNSAVKLGELLRVVYPQKCAADPLFVETLVKKAVSEDREDELVETLTSKIANLGLKQQEQQQAIRSGSADARPKTNPSSAFLHMTMLEMQVNTLEHAVSSTTPEAAFALLSTTCSGLIRLFQDMPLGGLCDMSAWEHATLDTVMGKFVSLGQDVAKSTGLDSISDEINLFVLGLAIQRGSLHNVLAAVERLISSIDGNRAIRVDPVLQMLLERLARVELRCPLGVDQVYSEHARPDHEVHVRWDPAVSVQGAKRSPVQGGADLRAFNADDEEEEKDNDSQAAAASSRKEVGERSGRPARLKVGDLVRLATPAEPNAALRPGEIGRIYYDDGGNIPFRVAGPRGPSDHWFRESSLVRLTANDPVLLGTDAQRDSSRDDTYEEATQDHEFPGRHDTAGRVSEQTTSLAGVREGAAVSRDGQFIFICGDSVGGLAKIGSGNAALGGSPTVPGHVYAHVGLPFKRSARSSGSHCYAWIAAVGDQVQLFTRKAGSLRIKMDSFDVANLARTHPTTQETRPSFHRTSMASHVKAEQLVSVRGATALEVTTSSDDWVKLQLMESAGPGAAAAAAWCGNGSSWLTGAGKWYFEVRIMSQGRISIGLATPAFFNQESCDDAAWLFDTDRAMVTDENGSTRSFGQVCQEGDVIGCALEINPSNSKVRIMFSRNGSWGSPMGTAFEMDDPVLFVRPVIMLSSDGASGSGAEPASQQFELSTPQDPLEQDQQPNQQQQQAPASPNSVEVAQATVPVVRAALSCVEVQCGDIREDSGESPEGRSRFAFSPPEKEYRPVADSSSGQGGFGDDEDDDEEDEANVIVDDSEDVNSNGADTLGPLPPMATDGRFIYLVQTGVPLLPPIDPMSKTTPVELVVEVLDPLKDLDVVKRIRFDQSLFGDSPLAKLDSLLEWKLCSNGHELMVTHDLADDAHTPGAAVKLVSRNAAVLSLAQNPASFWRQRGWPGHDPERVRVLSHQRQCLGTPDNMMFEVAHNVLWTWESSRNALNMFSNNGLVAPNNFDSSKREPVWTSRLEVCVETLQAIAKISAPFVPAIPLKGVFSAQAEALFKAPKTAAAASLEQQRRDVFLDPRYATLEGIVSVLKGLKGLKRHSKDVNGGMTACLTLLLVNCNAYASTWRDQDDAIDFDDVQEILGLCVGLVSDKNEELEVKELAVELILHGLNLFLPELMHKVRFVDKHLQTVSHDQDDSQMSTLISGVLQAMSAQLLASPFLEHLDLLKPVLARPLRQTTARKEGWLR